MGAENDCGAAGCGAERSRSRCGGGADEDHETAADEPGGLMAISTHVLDTAKGRPAEGVAIRLEDDRGVIARGVTNADGRLKLIDDPPARGTYRITFDTGGYD